MNSFDNSIYDCYKTGIKLDKYEWIESQNKKMFEMGNKKLSYLRLRGFAENGKFNLIEETIKKYSLKKMGLSPINIAERKKCVRIAKEIVNNKIIEKSNFDYKFYKNYLNDLDNSMKFKIDCMDKKINIIKKQI